MRQAPHMLTGSSPKRNKNSEKNHVAVKFWGRVRTDRIDKHVVQSRRLLPLCSGADKSQSTGLVPSVSNNYSFAS